MTRISGFAVAAAVLWTLVGAGSASADTITIASGVLDVVNSSGHLSIAGNEGFTFHSDFNVGGGIFLPRDQCLGLCAPGTTLDLKGLFSGNDLQGTATLNGKTYTDVGGLLSESAATVLFAGRAILPPFTGEDSAFTQAPFTFSGHFFALDQGNRDLAGFGTTSIWLTVDRSFGEGLISWRPTEVRYDFAVTPEPASVVLLGGGLMMAAFVAWRRRTRVAQLG